MSLRAIIVNFSVLLAVLCFAAAIAFNATGPAFAAVAAAFGLAIGFTDFWHGPKPAVDRVRRLVQAFKGSDRSPAPSYGGSVPEIAVDCDGVVVGATKTAAKMLNIGTGNLPMAFNDVFSGHSKSPTEFCKDVENDVASPMLLKVETAVNDAFVQVNWLPKVQGRGQCRAILTDVTNLKLLEAQFVQGHKMQALGQLAGGIAHDFNNILTAISGYCDLLLLDKTKDHPDHNDLQQISNNANRAADLVQHLLAFSRRQTLRPDLINVNSLVSQLSSLLNRLVGEKVTLTFNRTPELPGIYADTRQLEQVIMNLVVNARDAMPDGGMIEISTSSVLFAKGWEQHGMKIPAGEYVQIDVRDTGVGMASDVRDKIFEPFYTTKKSGEGTGLGLSTVYGIIKQSRGYVMVDSTIGQGTCFTVYLPAAQKSVADAPPPAPKEAAHGFGLSGARVLLVEDETPVRAFASKALALQGVTVEEAASGEEALELFENSSVPPDVVVSDVVMPGMNGPEWVALARKTKPHMKVVFVSGYADDVLQTDQFSPEDTLFLPKPYSLKHLIEAVQSQVNR
ncbi:MAG: ATP-binding protein [Pseudomonadota bacterium]